MALALGIPAADLPTFVMATAAGEAFGGTFARYSSEFPMAGTSSTRRGMNTLKFANRYLKGKGAKVRQPLPGEALAALAALDKTGGAGAGAGAGAGGGAGSVLSVPELLPANLDQVRGTPAVL